MEERVDRARDGAARVVALFGIACSAGCTATRLDIIAENEINDLGTGGTSSEVGGDSTGGTPGEPDGGSGSTPEHVVPFPAELTLLECTQGTYPGYGSYHVRLRSTKACMAAGSPTVLGEFEDFTLDAYLVDMVSPCVTSGMQNWKIGSFDEQYSFQLINAATRYSLDTKFGGVTPGTEIILYETNSSAAQQYVFNPRVDGTFGIVSKNATGLCVTATDQGVQILLCDSANPLQGWEFIPDYCG